MNNPNTATFNDIEESLFDECKKHIPSLKKEDRLLDGLNLLIDEIKRNMEVLKG